MSRELSIELDIDASWPTPLAAIVQRTISPSGIGLPGADWQGWFREQMSEWRFALDAHGIIRHESQDVGEFRFYSVDEVVACHSSAPWFWFDHACPWLGPPLGFIRWDDHSMDRDIQWSFRTALVRTAWGWIARPHRGEARPIVAEVTYPLIEGLDKEFGFGCGEWFLSLEGDYMDYAAEQVRQALRDAGVIAPVTVMDSEGIQAYHLTPLAICGDEMRTLDGVKVAYPYKHLSDRIVKIWSIDHSVLEDFHFWSA